LQPNEPRAPGAPMMAAAPLDRAAVRAAAAWLARLHADDVNAEDLAACERWRKASPEHERAWQRALQIRDDIGQLPAGIARQVLDRPQPTRRSALRSLGLLSMAAPTGYLLWTGWGHHTLTGDHHTAVGERRELMLPDGTKLHLNTDTAIDVAHTHAQRSIVLRHGELLVDAVADAAERPVVVNTPCGALEAKRGRFLVRAEPDGASVQLAVFSGAVAALLPHGTAQSVAAGSAVDFDRETFSLPRAANAQEASWVRGLIVAQDQRLDDFLHALGRHRRGVLRCDPAVAHLRLSGAFPLDRSEEVIDALPAKLPVQVVWRTRWWVSAMPRA
jgi:transmembrane sensor